MSGSTGFRIATFAAIVALSGCASLRQSQLSPATVHFERTIEEQACIDWFAKLDTAIVTKGVADAEAMRLSGFPHLRVNRFLASFRDELDTTEKRSAWLQHLRRLGAERRSIEIRNLPANALAGIASDRAAASEYMRKCGELLASVDLASPIRMSALRNRAVVPDDYSLLKRTIGIYPLVRIPFLAGVRSWQRGTLEAFARSAEMEPGHWREYSIASSPDSTAFTLATPRFVSRDALGIPVIGAQELQALSQRHAPVFRVGNGGSYDKFGRLESENDGAMATPEARVDIAFATVYVRHDFTRYGAMTLLQLTYTLWFPERPADRAIDLLSGKLDGVMVRMTFAPNGEIVLADSAHACGCYHLFFPSETAIARPAPDTMEEWAFVPSRLPTIGSAQHLRVWLASRTHYLTGLDVADLTGDTNKFSLATNSEAMLKYGGQIGDGAPSRSLYRPSGLVDGTERSERFFFWPMGIASAGQMRQWGHHATAFVGRRHFDDAHLIEKYFDLSFNAKQ